MFIEAPAHSYEVGKREPKVATVGDNLAGSARCRCCFNAQEHGATQAWRRNKP